MRKCTSRYFLSLGLISVGSVVVLFLQVQWTEYRARQNTDNYTNMTVEIAQTNTAVVSERSEVSEISEVSEGKITSDTTAGSVSEVSEEKIFESLMMERREVMRAACHQTGLDKKDRGDYLLRTSVEHCGGQRFRCCYVSSLTP